MFYLPWIHTSSTGFSVSAVVLPHSSSTLYPNSGCSFCAHPYDQFLVYLVLLVFCKLLILHLQCNLLITSTMASVGHCGLLASRMSFKTISRNKVNILSNFAINNFPSYCFPWAQPPIPAWKRCKFNDSMTSGFLNTSALVWFRCDCPVLSLCHKPWRTTALFPQRNSV